jgi:hypothetical protein
MRAAIVTTEKEGESQSRTRVGGEIGRVMRDEVLSEVEVARALRLFFPISVCDGDSEASLSVCLLVVGDPCAPNFGGGRCMVT